MSKQEHKIEIADEQSQPVDCDPLIQVVKQILTDHSIEESEVSIAIVDDPTIRKLNKQFLDHDYETDVLSFVLEYDETIGSLSGQLVVSTDTAARLAKEVGGSMQDELLLYVVHGTLHLVGFDDKDTADADEMRSAEKRYLQSVGVEHHWEAEAGSDRSEPKAATEPDNVSRTDETGEGT